MSFTTRTLRDTVVNAAGAGGTVTVLVNIQDDTTANNAILDASGLDGHANGAKLDIKKLEKNIIKAPNRVDALGISSKKTKARIEIIGNLRKSKGAK